MQDPTYRVLDQYRKDSDYADEVGKRYHFGEKHHSLLNAPGTPFLYYEPGRNGAGEYFGCGVLGHITPDPEHSEPKKPRFFIDLLNYQAFPSPVPAFDKDDKRRETEPYFNPQNAVRRIAPDVVRSICAEAGVQITAPAGESRNPPDLAAAFKAVADFCRDYPSMPGGLPTHDDRASVVKTNLGIIANWLGRKLGNYKGLHLKVRTTAGAGAFPRVPWVCILPPNQEVKRGIYAGICFGMEGAGVVAGCLRSVSNPVQLTTTTRTSKGPPAIDVGAFNDAYANPLEMRIDELDQAKLLEHLRTSLDMVLDRLAPAESQSVPGHWIFQGNPEYFDIDQYLLNQKQIQWQLRQYADRLKPGAEVLIWRSGKNGGVIAECVTESGPLKGLPEDALHLYHKPPGDTAATPSCRLRVLKHYVNTPILRQRIAEELPKLSIITFANNTNYPISTEEYTRILELREESAPEVPPEEVFTKAQADIGETGFTLPKGQPSRLLVSLASKPFVILTGNSGTGKTKLAELAVRWLCGTDLSHHAMVPVGADWTDNRNVLGFVNHLRMGVPAGEKAETPIYQSTSVLDLLLAAARPDNRNRPFFLILDEMNLSHVERYFADFLSALESQDGRILLHREGRKLPRTPGGPADVPETLPLPRNVFVIGTVNVDETTYMFSPKVLDRANVIEFRVEKGAPKEFLKSGGKPVGSIAAAPPGHAEAFFKLSCRARGLNGAAPLLLFADPAALPETDKAALDNCNVAITDIFALMQQRHQEFAFRSMSEILRSLAVYYQIAPEGEDWNWQKAMDFQILQRILPKLHGSKRKIGSLLAALAKYCENGNVADSAVLLANESLAEAYPATEEKREKSPRFKESHRKLCDMVEAVRRDQFVSFIQ